MRRDIRSWLHLAVLCGAAIFLNNAGSCDDSTTSEPEGGPDLQSGLLAYYRFESDASDSSPNGHDGTLLGGATANGALATGANDTDALSLPAEILDGAIDLSIVGWVRMDTFHIWPSQWISVATATEDNNLGIWYDPNNDRWAVCLFDVSTPFAQNAVLEDTEWHHIAVTRNAGSMSLYVDGDAVPPAITVSSDAVGVDTGGFIVGQDQDVLGGGFSADNSLAGEVDELRIYDRAISAAEVAAIRALGR